MESIYIQQREAIATILQQARTGILQLKEWTADVPDIKALPLTMQGSQDLAGDCMLLQAICESIKQVNKRSSTLLSYRSEIPWRHVMSMRDRVAHGYFEIDIDYVDEIIRNDLDPLLAAIEALIAMLPDLSDEALFESR